MIKRAKCKSCNHEYNIFIIENGKSFEDYPCHNCKSKDKEEINYTPKLVKGFVKVGEAIEKNEIVRTEASKRSHEVFLESLKEDEKAQFDYIFGDESE